MIVMKLAIRPFLLFFLAISIAFVTSQIVLSAYAQSNNTVVYSKDSSPYGVPYKDWIARWWQWDVGIPSSQHPRDHYTSESAL